MESRGIFFPGVLVPGATISNPASPSRCSRTADKKPAPGFVSRMSGSLLSAPLLAKPPVMLPMKKKNTIGMRKVQKRVSRARSMCLRSWRARNQADRSMSRAPGEAGEPLHREEEEHSSQNEQAQERDRQEVEMRRSIQDFAEPEQGPAVGRAFPDTDQPGRHGFEGEEGPSGHDQGEGDPVGEQVAAPLGPGGELERGEEEQHEHPGQGGPERG